MDYSQVQKRARRALSERMFERYPMSNSDLFSSDSSGEFDISDLVYRNLRFKPPPNPPFRLENFVDGSVPVSFRSVEFRPQSVAACTKCNQIRTNPRFRPSSFHCYSQLLNEKKIRSFEADGDSTDEQDGMIQRRVTKSRRRTRTKSHLR